MYKAINRKPGRPSSKGNTLPMYSVDIPRAERRQLIRERYKVLNIMLDSVKNGTCRSMIVYGPPGLGKSYSVFDKLKDQEITTVKGHCTPGGLVKTLFKHRDGGVIVFDDTDSVLMDPKSLALLKAATDSSKTRVVSYKSTRTIEADDELGKVESSFEFKGTIVFITNMDFNNAPKAISPHTQAIISRSTYVDLGLRTRDDYIDLIEHVVSTTGILDALDKDDQDVIMNYIKDNKEKWIELSLRTVVQLADLYTSVDDWKLVAKHTKMRSVI